MKIKDLFKNELDKLQYQIFSPIGIFQYDDRFIHTYSRNRTIPLDNIIRWAIYSELQKDLI